MDITEVRIKLMEDSDDRLQAFCSITFDDCFVVRDLKIIEGTHGPFVAMPSRKLTSHCGICRAKNHLRAGYCNHCGAKQRDDRTVRDADGRAKLYADVAHPINALCREMIQNRVIAEFQTEIERAKLPGYQSRYDDDYGADAGEDFCPHASEEKPSEPSSAAVGQEQSAIAALASRGRRIDTPHAESGARLPSHLLPTAPKSNDPPRRPRGDFGAGIFE